jgi:hypothetical protein
MRIRGHGRARTPLAAHRSRWTCSTPRRASSRGDTPAQVVFGPAREGVQVVLADHALRRRAAHGAWRAGDAAHNGSGAGSRVGSGFRRVTEWHARVRAGRSASLAARLDGARRSGGAAGRSAPRLQLSTSLARRASNRHRRRSAGCAQHRGVGCRRSTLIPITDDPSEEWAVEWAPSGDTLYYTSNR